MKGNGWLSSLVPRLLTGKWQMVGARCGNVVYCNLL